MNKHFINTKDALISAALGLLLAFSLFIVAVFFRGKSFYALLWIPTNVVACGIVLLLFALALASGFYLLLQRFPAYCSTYSEKQSGSISRRIVFTKQGIITVSCAIFLCWLPAALIMYPTASNLDFFNQIYQYQASAPTWYTTMGVVVDAEFIDHHPIFDTLFFGSFYMLGDALGSQNAGLFLLNITINAMLAFGLGLACCYLERLQLPGSVRVAAVLFAALFPYYAFLAAGTTKDTLFSAFFVPFLICYMEIQRTGGGVLKSKAFVMVFVLVTGLCLLTKKLGIYICIPSLLVLLIPLKNYRKQLVVITVSVLLFFSLLIPQFIYTTCDVAPGGRQETLGFALQQSITLIREKPEAVSDDDLAIIDKVVNVETATEKYNKTLSDAVKNRFRSSATTEDIVRYLGAWAKGGLQHPVIYTKSLLMCSARLFLPSSSIRFDIDITDEDHRTRWSVWFHDTSEGFDFKAKRPSSLLAVAGVMQAVVTEGLACIPVLGLLTTKGLYGGWLPFVVVVLTFFCRKRNTYALTPVIFTVLLLLVSPGSLSRYVVCLVFCVIPMLGWMLYSVKERKTTFSSTPSG